MANKCKLCGGPCGKDDPNNLETVTRTRFKLDIPDEIAAKIEEGDTLCCGCWMKFVVDTGNA